MANLLLGRSQRASHFACHTLALKRCMSFDRAAYSSKSEPQRHLSPTPSKVSIPVRRYLMGGTDVQPGEHVLSVCKKHHILFPTALRGLKIRLRKNPCQLAALFSEDHCFERNSMKYLDKYEHPFAKSVLNMYISQTKTPLWSSMSSMPTASVFPCETAKRKLKHAFRDALAVHGYDREGRRVATGNESIIADLYGTVQLTCGDPIIACNMKFADLLEQVMGIVSVLELALGRDKNGRYINPAQRLPKSTF
ncbi:hypothetical protein F4818DRAFT_248211 [Hypoxylon cercidicola]|nr:hypothetical protein F4818DRAFT_248211 [Hypoxylon cercidicola]